MKNKKGQSGLCNKQAYVEPDGLTKLPNDILLNILDRLHTLDAFRTCILSKKTIDLPSELSRFVADVDSFAPMEDDMFKNSLTLGKEISLGKIIKTNSCVVDAADKILNFRNQQINLTRVRMRFFLRYNDCLSIGKVAARAMAAHNIDIVEFEILPEKKDPTVDELQSYAKVLNNFIRACPDTFAGLTRLRLDNLRFGESDIPNILATCKRLKSLRLKYSHPGIGSMLEVQHPHLVELEIFHGEFELVKLSCLPKLKRMVYYVWASRQDPISLGHVPLLSSLHLSNERLRFQSSIRLSQLLGNVTYISELELDFRSERIWVEPESPVLLAPVLGKLQIVDLVDLPEECDIAWTMFVLEAAPSLKELRITVWDHWCTMERDMVERKEMGYFEEKTNVEWQPSVPDLKHMNLSKLTIYGFQPDNYFMRYIRNVMKTAVNLGDISLHDRRMCKTCVDPEIKAKVSPSRYPRTDVERDLLRKQITKGLEVALPDIIHFRSRLCSAKM